MKRPANRQAELELFLTVVISFFIHLVALVMFISPQIYGYASSRRLFERASAGPSRDIIVNINQDDKRVVTDQTLLSDRDSSAKGFITRKPGDRWLNNSLDFQVVRGNPGRGSGRDAASQEQRRKVLLSDESELSVTIQKSAGRSGEAGDNGIFEKVVIPDRNNVTRENAIFYSNDGRFSFNTVKFKHFEYFKKLKDKIASNWYPPLMANSIIHGYNPLTGNYTPGSTRIMVIPSQEVKIVFVLDSQGEVKELKLLDSMGVKPLDRSCVDAIQMSKNFGPVPRELLTEGKVLVIPFIFGYYVY